MTAPAIHGIAPCFIVHHAGTSAAFYRDRLGFSILFAEPQQDPFFVIVIRDNAMLFLKSVGVPPQPNVTRHPWAPWDAYLNVPDPDALAAEFAARSVAFAAPLHDTDDGLRGFEIRDPDGYILFFGRPRPRSI